MCRLNRAKWCYIHKRVLHHENDGKWWTVTCPGHFKVSFPLTEGTQAAFLWSLERFGFGSRTHILYGR